MAEPVVSFLLGEKWIECVPYMRIFCIYFVFWPIHTANLNAIKALGRSDIILKQEIAKKVSGIVILLLAIPGGVLVMAYSLLLESFVSQIINSWPNRKLIEYSYLEQLRDISKSILLAAFMGIGVYPVTMLGLGDFTTILVQVTIGATVYILGSYLLKIDTFNFIWNIITDIYRGIVGRYRQKKKRKEC